MLKDYDRLDAEILELADSLQDADDATVAAEMRRLKDLAAQIPDELSRTRAMARRPAAQSDLRPFSREQRAVRTRSTAGRQGAQLAGLTGGAHRGR
jgi:hypothetical protein